MAPLPDITFDSLRGGFDDTTPLSKMAKDACTEATNVEFFWTTLGERRWGCDAFDITGSGLDSYTQIVHLSQWFPANVVLTPEIWAVGATPGSAAAFRYRSTSSVWTTPTVTDALDATAPNVYKVTTVPGPSSLSPNGKLFVFYPNSVSQDRSHVWDPNNTSVLRRTGLPEPSPPTVADEGAGTFTGAKRWYRIRLVRQAGTNNEVTVRSEPSTSVAITPSGTGAGIRITQPALAAGEAQTHWEIEGSFDDATYYVLQSVAIGTTTWDDVFTNPISFSDEGTLSEAIGAYLLPPNAKFGAVDGDRLVMAGHWTDVSLQSTVWWTPTFSDPGAGNDERVPIVTTGGLPIVSSLSLDNFSGGGITGMSTAIVGSWYVFKWNRIYKLSRTNQVAKAYQSITMSTTRGAIEGSIFDGVDETGSPAIYFLDPVQGPSMISQRGLRAITGVRRTWNRVNLGAANVIARGLFYPYKRQAHWWVATENADTPNYKLVLQTTELQDMGAGIVGRGWSTATGRITEAYCCAVITEEITENGAVNQRARPYIGLNTPDFIQRCDGELAIDDAGTAYVATVTSAPQFLTGLRVNWGAMATALLASANPSTSVKITLIKDFGLESQSVTSSLAPTTANEPYVVKQQDGLVLSESVAIQIKFSDPS